MKKSKFAANTAFFNQAKQDNNFVAGVEDEVMVPAGKHDKASAGAPAGGTITEKGLINAYKRAKQTGTFIV